MATTTISSTPQATPPSASNSGGSAAQTRSLSTAPSKNKVGSAENNGVFHGDEKKPDLALDDLDSALYTGRIKNLESDYTCRLIAKYFSGKSLDGGDIFDEQMTIDDEIIKSSRLPCFHSYVNPVVGFEELCSNGSTPGAETTPPPPNMSNGKHTGKNN